MFNPSPTLPLFLSFYTATDLLAPSAESTFWPLAPSADGERNLDNQNRGLCLYVPNCFFLIYDPESRAFTTFFFKANGKHLQPMAATVHLGQERPVPLGTSNINSPTHRKSEQAKQHLATPECEMQSDGGACDKASGGRPAGKARAPGIEHLCNIYGFDLSDVRDILPCGGSSEEQNVPPELALPLPTHKISNHVPTRPPRPRANSGTPSLAFGQGRERLSSRSSPSKLVPSLSSSITPAAKSKMQGHSERDVDMETRDQGQGESCVDMDIWGSERVDSGLRGYRYYDVFRHFLCDLYRFYRLDDIFLRHVE